MSITDYEVYMETNRLAVLATTAIQRAMKQTGIRRSELAKRLGIPRSRVTKVLEGETNMTLKTLASFGLACGVRWQFLATDATEGTFVVPWVEFDPTQLLCDSSETEWSAAALEFSAVALACSVGFGQGPESPTFPSAYPIAA